MAPATPDRRDFLATAAAGAAALTIAPAGPASEKAQLAVLGGPPVRTAGFPAWPQIEQADRDAWKQVLEERTWCRLGGHFADTFEQAYAQVTGTKACVATANGTSALFASLGALGLGPGDEVLVPPYTFVATINVVLLHYALPVFVDTDRETFQMDARKIEAAVTPKTACILPVHLGGNACDLDAILEIGRRRKLPVIEDTCQTHLGEWKGKKLGSYGQAGCFSFQVSKNLSGGEGGAIITNDEDFAEKCFAFHNNGRGRKRGLFSGGANLRMTEFQAALLLAQMTRIEAQAKARDENGKYLTHLLQEIPGIHPAKQYEGCTRNAYHLYMFRYDKEKFAGASRSQFLKALRAEGIPCSGGYTPLNTEAFIRDTLNSKGYKAIYGEARLKAWADANRCPENDRLCGEAVWFTQNMLLGPRSDMDQIATAIRKIHANAGELAKA
jgi:dTDP-4-amino-4,6-dideoxygalactose transaminase